MNDLKRIYREEFKDLEARLSIPYKFWNGKLVKPIKEHYKISLCTTCMNRATDLKVSLPKNIQDNSDYDNVEFVVLDYNGQDNLGDWIKKDMMDFINQGKLVYARTDEPRFYSMTHSRNLAFKVASGDIVNNIDADNYTNAGFANHINKLANEIPQKAIFAKGKKMLRGRLGFFKKDFIDLLGGYDEEIQDYGHDDWDLMNRAWFLGFTMMWYGGTYYGNVGSPKHQTTNMFNTDWKETELRNKTISARKTLARIYKANEGKHWGKGHIVKNFSEEIDL